MYADSIYYNGKIVTCSHNRACVDASAIAVSGKSILAVGNDSDISVFRGPDTTYNDLQGKMVVPGFVEGHTHLLMQGEASVRVDCDGMTEEEVIKNIRRKTADIAAGEWVTGQCGFRCSGWSEPETGFMSVAKLDALLPHNPFVVIRVNGGNLIVRANTLALKAAGIDPNAEIYGSNGLRPEVDSAIKAAMPPHDDAYEAKLFQYAEKEMFSFGVTSCLFVCATNKDADILRSLYERDALQLRVSLAFGGIPDSTVEDYRKYCAAEPVSGLYDDRYAARMIKFFTDGTFGRHTAALTSPYSDDPDCIGKLNYSDTDLYDIVFTAAKAGYQTAGHTVGDRAMKQILDVYEKVIEELDLQDHRLRVEHLQLIQPEDPLRMKKYGILASMQPAHAPYNRVMSEVRLGKERSRWLYALRPVQEAGVLIAGGSDAPIQSANPFVGMYAAVTRKCEDSQPAGGYFPENSITREQALLAYTIQGSYAVFADKTRGSLEPGKNADLAILDRDILNCDPDEIKDIRPLCTVCAGKIVYEA